METPKAPTIVSNSPTKFTTEEIAELNSIKQRFDINVTQFGQLFIQKLDLQEAETSLISEKKAIEQAEQAFLSKVVSKYGEGTFDPSTGIFTPKA